ncbi:MAG: transcription elongation factor GreA [Candidatus Uhrbacteria bacterium]|nr:transcription elongation factor GreA [Candidatus Uhrbacteria bacterium]
MQIPKRRAQTLKVRDDQDGANQLTPAGFERLKNELKKLQREQPEAVEDVSRLAQLGDFSENAEYQEAKFRLRRINDRLFIVKDRLMRATIIKNDANPNGSIGLGSTVTLAVNGKKKVYQIVGARESNPSRGRISNVSPLGAALIGHAMGESVTIKTEEKETVYKILEVK